MRRDRAPTTHSLALVTLSLTHLNSRGRFPEAQAGPWTLVIHSHQTDLPLRHSLRANASQPQSIRGGPQIPGFHKRGIRRSIGRKCLPAHASELCHRQHDRAGTVGSWAGPPKLATHVAGCTWRRWSPTTTFRGRGGGI